MAEAESRKKGSAAELLGNWRAAERDLIAAKGTLDVASLAANAAQAAVEAAEETSEAARLGAEAASRAQRSAERTAEAAAITAEAAQREHATSDGLLESAVKAEKEAGDAYHEAQRQGFPKD